MSVTFYVRSYTPKSFVLYGDTKPFKEEIKALGGSWNPYLAERLKAWVFPTTRRPIVNAWLDKIAKDVPEVTVEELSPLAIKIKSKNKSGAQTSYSRIVTRVILIEAVLAALFAGACYTYPLLPALSDHASSVKSYAIQVYHAIASFTWKIIETSSVM